jgi:spore germination cell wall hydrolase CwlJ-like protein
MLQEDSFDAAGLRGRIEVYRAEASTFLIASPAGPVLTAAARPRASRPLVRPARAYRFQPASGVEARSAIECLTAAAYYEAVSEGERGMAAVAQVVLNRTRHPAYPSTICGVVFQGAQRSTGCQFTFTCDGSLNRAPAPAAWRRAEAVALAALGGYVVPEVGEATHYHATWMTPYWAASLSRVAQLGGHAFYRSGSLKGDAPAARRTSGPVLEPNLQQASDEIESPGVPELQHQPEAALVDLAS